MKRYFTHARLAAIYMFNTVFLLCCLGVKIAKQKPTISINSDASVLGKLAPTGQSDSLMEIVILVAAAAYVSASALYYTIKAIGDEVRAASGSAHSSNGTH